MNHVSLKFPFGPFHKSVHNPILFPQGDSWEAKDLFNPTAIVKDGKIYLLYRAEDHTGRGIWNGTSRIGLAVSSDGIYFERYPKPVLFPTEPYEYPGGCEDPRIVQLDDTFYLTYTAFDGKTARLCLATSKDLLQWEKHGVLFPRWNQGPIYEWTKSGAIVPQKIHNRYVMYFGDSDIWIAFSDDGIHWHPHEECVVRRSEDPQAFDSLLIEPGPSPVVTDEGILLFYNAAKSIQEGPHAGKPYYSVGQVLFSLHDPKKVLSRTETPFFIPEKEDEVKGQVDFVVFAEGLVNFKGKWLLYYGMADSRVGVASLQTS
ncbi:glycosylase [Collibacillus ludicampi]|uniref:Glycosylase n=1 Tax=Collibacillus ludicampi TaxID=2771369 RepID=A0AAV4LDH4_9BACL|nr:glycoside hydrolase family 130 protein [Collibacillus ludicampi]GIM45818.1 glycosylase [Collibacillus ludicampi]